MFCSQCGIENRSAAHFYNKCGNARSGNTVQTISTTQPQVSLLADESKKFLGNSYHPCRRLFAKTVDIFTVGVLALLGVAFAVGLLFPIKAAAFAKAGDNQMVTGMFVLMLWVALEAILLSAIGSTPARWLFGISVKTTYGSNISSKQALKRSLLVALQGMALGIPFAAIFTQIFAYQRLANTGTALWDTATGSVVTHKTWSIGRTIACVVSVFFVFALISVSNIAGR